MYGSFYGWYFKCQAGVQTLAVIPAVHQTGRHRTCSIQFITENDAWTVEFPNEAFRRTGKTVFIGANRFGQDGVWLEVNTPELRARGRLEFGPLTPLKYDIMGPFAFVPFLECRHSVWSMRHPVRGKMRINGQDYVFRNGWGYWEGDRGRSFPKEYAWTQCCFPGGSLMLSVADIPVAGFHFTGIISVVWWKGKEYRLATYLGARVSRNRNGEIRIVQGQMELEARMLEVSGRPLKAPNKGVMARIIHESAACSASYRFRIGKRILFAFETDRASFEYEYPWQEETVRRKQESETN